MTDYRQFPAVEEETPEREIELISLNHDEVRFWEQVFLVESKNVSTSWAADLADEAVKERRLRYNPNPDIEGPYR